jgi:hypothetical protein
MLCVQSLIMPKMNHRLLHQRLTKLAKEFVLFLLIALFERPCVTSLSLSTTRRQILLQPIVLGSLAAPQNANAARGAAELDLEFYVRDLIGGNRPEGNVQASTLPILAPPRTLSPFFEKVLNKECSIDCLATQQLIAQIQRRDQKRETALLEKEIHRQAHTIGEGARKSFYSRAPWESETMTDQYFFDLTAYSFWKTAAVLLPNFADRDMFVRNLGRSIYQSLRDERLLQTKCREESLSSSIPCVVAVLDCFVSTNFCKAYRLGEKIDDEYLFLDDIDNQAWSNGVSVDCLLSIFESATLGSSLQITGEQSRFIPDLVGPTIAAVWDTQSTVQWESYFVDPEYRPNPKDYFPNEQLFQYTLAKR